MATHVFGPDSRVFWGSVNFFGMLTGAEIDYSADAVDMTVCGQGTRSMKAGLKGWQATLSGHYQANSSGASVFAAVGSAPALTIWPDGSSIGDRAIFGVSRGATLSEFGAVGEIAPFELAVSGFGNDNNQNLVRGSVMSNGTTTSSSNGTVVQVGSVTSGQKVHMVAHVITLSGGSSPTIQFTLESDDNSGMSSATTRGAIAAFSATGSKTMNPVGGAITDDYWRVNTTITGSPTAVAYKVSVGIM